MCAGHTEVGRLLLAAGADPRLDAGPYSEATPLALAAMKGHTEVARALLDAGSTGRPGRAGALCAAGPRDRVLGEREP
ncbi:ankyrin repeat domain-containing protein [Streptomyces sp. NPDC048257]|uniref:ankyrin repeat domain-containing protein n=1 Tax=Streptomyces sp. NPDC048257 TaxID=3365526 RepID=UPI003710144C